MNRLLLLIGFLCCSLLASAQEEITGIWQSFDERSGEPNSQVTLYLQNGRLYGKISRIITGPSDARCMECAGKKYGQPIMGMQIIDGLAPSENGWTGGRILDVRNGNSYRVRLRLRAGTTDQLEVRGTHWTGISRTVTWQRLEKSK